MTGWRAPGHIPWGNLLDLTGDKKWLPEGSLYSPDDFSRALYQARAGHRLNIVQTEQEPCTIVDASLDKHPTTTQGIDSSSGTLAPMELIDMMRELKDLKNFFEGTSQEVSRIVQPEEVILPSLMISNSHCTFPLSLDSCQSFTLNPAVSLTDKARPPPPLLLRTPPDISYPSIPTAFLGSPSSYSPEIQDVDLANSSGLRIEDMINNLRLQCLSMALNTSPVNISLNSRSCSAAYEPVKKSAVSEAAEFAESSVGSKTLPANNSTSSGIIGNRLAAPTIPTAHREGTSPSRLKIANPHKIGTATKNLRTAKYARTDAPDKKPEALSKCISPPLLLRSSLAKHANLQPRSLKSVRFALSPLEFEKDVASLMYDDVWRSSQVSVQDHLDSKLPKEKTSHLSLASDKGDLEEKAHSIRQNAKSWHSTSTTLVSSGIKTKERIKSIIIKPSLRHSMVPNVFYDKDNDRPRRSRESRGRHSLSRIIKGPVFSGKEHKRATVSNTFSARWAKGTATQDNVVSKSIQRKSRMPVPLRNILTHFK